VSDAFLTWLAVACAVVGAGILVAFFLGPRR
jgi:hypothetical protein